MGFDPRQWRTTPGSRPITANVEALLAENEALRREVRALRQRLAVLLDQGRNQGHDQGRGSSQRRGSPNPEPRLTPVMVERWCAAMACHPGWTALRVGPPGGLRGLVDVLRRHWWNPSLSLEEELDRQIPGLGTELTAALRGPHSRGRWAVRAAFALYGPRAAEWLSEEPLRVVAELAQRVDQLERRQASRPGQGPGRRPGTRTANHSEAQNQDSGRTSGSGAGARGGPSSGAKAPPPGAGAPSAEEPVARPPLDPQHRQALRLLGLEPGASPQAIKRAYWRLAKAHHPDLGGDPEAFHRLEAAYRLLVG
jgi:DnaJ-domain-containing protein 1